MNVKETFSEKLRCFFAQKSALRLVALGSAGLLLLAVSGLFPEKKAGESPDSRTASGFDSSAYTQNLEKRLAEWICRMEGAGETMVMITLEEGENYVYVTDEKADDSRQNYETEHVLYNTGGASAPLLETTYMPVVRGVAILCEGGDNAKVAAKITEAVSALLDLGSNRISIAKIY